LAQARELLHEFILALVHYFYIFTMFGTCSKSQCGSTCGGADPVADRVKVDPTRLAGGKENAPPSVKTLDKIAEERAREEERRRAEAAEVERKRVEAQRKLAEEEAAAKAKAERLAATEREARQALLEQQRRLEEQARVEEEQRRIQEEKDKALREQQAKEEAERAADAAASQKVSKFLKDNGFSAVNGKKSSFMSHKYPLHAAVEKKDTEAIRALLRCKADPTLQNSSKKTPEQLARSTNKKGSQDQVLAVLMAPAQS